LIVHRTVWTAFLLLFTISIYSKWNDVFFILKNLKKALILFFSGILIVTNWFTWIYAVVTNRLVDASFGYYIFPILSVFFGIIFLKEPHNKKKLLAVALVIISVVYLLFNFESTPWVGLIVAVTWSTYNLIRKKLKVPADIGLFIESVFMTPFAIFVFYLLTKDGNNFFSPNDLKISFWLFLAGAMTLIPLFLYLKGVELSGLGPTGMIFFFAPTGQFLLGIFYYGEYLDINKLISFVIIWIAVAIYLHDLAQEE
jgi:chloramphenicol-sensitive protein RarD